MISSSFFWTPVVASFVIGLVATALVRAGARHFGIVAAPKADRWHKKPTAMLGGVGIFVAVNATLLFVARESPLNWYIVGASTLMFALGLVDDVLHLRPYHKLIVQVMAAAIVVYAGLVLPWTESPVFNAAITIFWLIGITNATNMLDNMDGLAAGIAAIAAIFLALNFLSQSQLAEAMAIAVLAAALIAFLVYNSQPASIFMGDCGSLYIGFFLASTALLTTTHARTRTLIPIIAVPVLTFVIPIFDTTFVTLLRKLAGRAASQGGRDHTSHRLVALGLSERRAVWLLYGLATVSGVLGIQVRYWQLHESMAAILGFVIVLTMAGVYLGGVKVYGPNETVARPFVSFLVDISYKRRVFETILDVTLIILAYYGAYTLRFGRMHAGDGALQMFMTTLPIVVFVKVGVFLVAGVYRGLWRYTTVSDLLVYARAVFVASIASVAVIWYVVGFPIASRTVYVVDGVLLLLLVAGSRVAFRVARGLFPRPFRAAGQRVLIFGAGDAGDLLLRELMNNPELDFTPAGFLDDDPKKVGKLSHGLRVYNGADVATASEAENAQEILLSTSKLSPGRLEDLRVACDALGMPLRQMRIQLALVNEVEAPAGASEVSAADSAPRLHVRTHGSTYLVGTSGHHAIQNTRS